MYYLLTYEVVAGYTEKRTAFRKEHLALALAAVERGELLLGGAFSDPTEGALLLFKSDSAAIVEEFAQQDPYVKNGLVTNWHVKQWDIVLGAGVEALSVDV